MNDFLSALFVIIMLVFVFWWILKCWNNDHYSRGYTPRSKPDDNLLPNPPKGGTGESPAIQALSTILDSYGSMEPSQADIDRMFRDMKEGKVSILEYFDCGYDSRIGICPACGRGHGMVVWRKGKRC